MATIASRCAPRDIRCGIGLRLPHMAEMVAVRPPVGWLEVHPENILANPHAQELVGDLAGTYLMSMHTVGVSIGSADGLDREHLRRLRRLLDRIEPALVSGHLAWSSLDGTYLNDLLPLPYTDESLSVVAQQLDEVQQALGREFIIENPSSYVHAAHSTMTEAEFLLALVARTGCRLLCDVSNVFLSGHNMGYDPFRFIDQIPAEAVVELHMGGFTAEEDPGNSGGTVLIDTHAAPGADGAWTLYRHAVSRFGAVPTIIEWDNDLPPLSRLVAEAATADQVCASARHAHAHAS
ncbi:MAG: DUF692 domain-containing protein [Vicinamibacterales bacterium]